MDKQTKLDFLRKHSLLQDLSEEELESIAEVAVEESYQTNETIFKEGGVCSDVYLILEGAVSVLKWDEEHTGQALLARLKKGDTFGESSFLHPDVRSSSIKTTKPTTVLKLARAPLEERGMKDTLLRIFTNIALLNTSRLITQSSLYVKKLKENDRYSELWHKLGAILLFLCIMLSFLGVAAMGVPAPFQNFFFWTAGALTTIVLIYSTKSKEYTWGYFGLNFNGVKNVILISLVVILVSASLSFLTFRFLGLESTIALQQLPVEWESTNTYGAMALSALYFFVFAFFQEFVGRGVLQTTFRTFFLHDEEGYKSLFIHAGVLFVFLLPLGSTIAFSTFLVSIPMGYLYMKQNTLVGVVLIHFALSWLGIIG